MALWVRFAEGFGTLEQGRIALHEGAPWDARPTGGSVAAAEVQLLAPLVPGQFICLWNNFRAAAEKNGNAIPETPLWFLKSPGALAGPGDIIRPPRGHEGRVIYEGELGVVIGRQVKHADEAEAAAAIFGYTCVNDVTAVELLKADPSFEQWARAKGADGFGPVGPGISTTLDWDKARVTVALNGRVRQDYPLADMILPPARIISLLSREMTLRPGDLIACGTSLGALPMKPGMSVAVSIDGIGTLENRYEAAD